MSENAKIILPPKRRSTVVRVSNLFVLLGPSAAGKTSVMEYITEKHKDVRFVPSYTTRTLRPGEVEGRHYRHISRAAFEEMLAKGQMKISTRINGAMYGTPLQDVLYALKHSKRVMLILDPNGAEQVERLNLAPVTIFLLPPNLEELGNRMLMLGRENIEERLLDNEDIMKKAFKNHSLRWCSDIERLSS